MNAATKRISLFKGVKTNKLEYDTTLGDWVHYCALPETASRLEPVRRETDEKRRAALKENLPAVSISATFSTRDSKIPLADKITSYNGVVCLDLDSPPGARRHMTPEEAAYWLPRVRELPYVWYASLSASGRGVYAYALTDNEDYKRHSIYWHALADDVRERLGLEMDTQTKDITRCRFLSHGPAIVNDDAAPFTLPPGYEIPGDLPEIKPVPITSRTLDDVEACVAEFERRGLVLGDGTYHTRYNLGTALKWLPDGFSFYRRLCAGYQHPRTPEAEYAGFPAPPAETETPGPNTPICLGTFFYEMRTQWGIVPPGPVYRLPLDGLAPEIQEIVADVAGAFQCSPELVLGSMYSAIAGVAGKKFSIVNQAYTNHAQMWIGGVIYSGDGKSPQMKYLLQPVTELDAEIERGYAAALQQWEAGDKSTPPPSNPAIIVSDATPEARDMALYENQNGVLMYVDELSQMLGDFGRYNQSGEVERWLSIFSNGYMKVKRKTQRTLIIPEPVCSIYGGTQPDTITRIFGAPQYANRGFYGRWLWIIPAPMRRTYQGGHAVSEKTSLGWSRLIRRIAKAPAVSYTLSDGADAMYGDWWNAIEARRTALDKNDTMREMLGKLPIHALRWALITQILAGDGDELEITPRVMEYSLRCMEYFEHTARKIVKLLPHKGRNKPARLTDEAAIQHLAQSHPELKKQMLADALGVSVQHISQVIKRGAAQDDAAPEE